MTRLKRVGCLLSKRRTQPRLPRPRRRWEGVVRVYETKENLWPTLRINTRKTCPESFTSMTSALTATCAGKPHPLISRAATTAATPMCLSNRPPWRRRRFARKPWKDVRLKPSATMAKAECDRTKMTMNCLAKPTQRTGKPEAPARASVPERLRRLKWNEAVWSGDFVADERLGLQLWEGPGVFRAGSFARPIYRKEETESFRPTSTRRPKP